MKKLYLQFLFFIFLFANAPTVYAAHIVGGYMSYQCIGGDDYRFTMVLYRDCFSNGAPFDSDAGAPFPGTVSVFVGTDSTPIMGSLLLDAPEVTLVKLNSLTGNCISGPTNLCIEEGVYTFDLTLPATIEPVHVVYQRCCRTATTTNIEFPGSVGMTFTQTIFPEARAVCNNSPVFNNKPMMCSVIDLGLYYHYHSLHDPDGDELSYSFCSPLIGGGDNITNATAPSGVAPDPDLPPPFGEVGFLPPIYSPQMPIPGSPHFQINETSGVMIGRGSIIGSFVYGICVDERRNGVLLSTTNFEFIHRVTGTPLSVEDASFKNNQLIVQPNPVDDLAIIKLPYANEDYSIEIHDLNGKCWVKEKCKGVDQWELNLNDLPKGVYTITAISEHLYLNNRMIVQ